MLAGNVIQSLKQNSNCQREIEKYVRQNYTPKTINFNRGKTNKIQNIINYAIITKN